MVYGPIVLWPHFKCIIKDRGRVKQDNHFSFSNILSSYNTATLAIIMEAQCKENESLSGVAITFKNVLTLMVRAYPPDTV